MKLFKIGSRRKWYGKVKTHDGEWKQVALSEDKRTAEKMLAALQNKQDLVRAEVLPVSALDVDRRPLPEQLTDYIDSMRQAGKSAAHVNTTEARCRAALAALGDKIEAEPMKKWLATKRSEGMSVGTSNAYLTACRMFCRWLVKMKRRPTDPLAGVEKLNAEASRRRVRRVLSAEDFAKLLDASSADHRWLYRLAATTGLRASELGALTPESFHLEGDTPTVSVAAGYTKARKTAVQPIPRSMVAELREWLTTRQTGLPLWGATWARDKHGGTWLKRDLERAGIPYKVDGKQFDFHALRYQFITTMARHAPLAVVQKLARHSTPDLTANTYLQLGLTELADVVNRAAGD